MLVSKDVSNMEQTNLHFSEEELKFCISALQLEIEDSDPDSTEYIQKLDKIQDEFLLQNNSFKSADLIQVYILVERERDYLNQVLDNLDIFGEQRQEAQHYLRTANSILRKLKKFFQSLDVNLPQ